MCSSRSRKVPDEETYREISYQLEAGEYTLSIYDGHRVQRIGITATWATSITIKLQPKETCDIEEVTT